MLPNKRAVVTGMAVVTPVADTLPGFLDSLLCGRSAVGPIRVFDPQASHVKIAADLSGYDGAAGIDQWSGQVPEAVLTRFRRLAARLPWAHRITLRVALDGWRDAGLFDAGVDPTRAAMVVAGHNINANYQFANQTLFAEEPDFIDGLFGVYYMDTNHGALVSELLRTQGLLTTVGGACASGNLALRSALREIRNGDADVVTVLGPVWDFSPLDVQALALLNAVSHQSFNDEPARASRPFDTGREGFVVAHSAAVLVLESLEHARRRGARIHAELLAAEANSDSTYLPQPSEESQARLMRTVLDKAGLPAERIGYVNAHATSTPLGDLTETRAIRRVFGSDPARLKINATKSMLGHPGWPAALVETIGAILQMKAGRLHPSINIDDMDPEIDLDVCRDGPVDWAFDHFIKNSFGFGGINAVSLFGRWLDGDAA